MVLVMEREEWELNPFAFISISISCCASLYLLRRFARSSSSSPFDLAPPFLRFQRSFLLLYSIASAAEGLGSVSGEYEYAQYGMSRENMAMCLAVGAAGALLVGSFLGLIFDLLGARKACILFFVLHLLIVVLKSAIEKRSVMMASFCLALASSIFSFGFESWMVIEHEKQGHKQNLLNDTFWMMTFYESASLIGSQGIANLFFKNLDEGFFTPVVPLAILAAAGILYVRKECSKSLHIFSISEYGKLFLAHLLDDKRIYVLSLAQASIYFSMSIFWVLWGPTIVADGREVQLSLIYPCFLGSRMLGSTVFPWVLKASSIHSENFLTGTFVVGGLALLIVAYDYQEIGVLVALFSIFHACVGFILPSLARLRTVCVPNELRGGMMSLSQAPANAALLWILIQGGYYRKIENSVIWMLAAIGLLVSAGFFHMWRRWRKHPRQEWHTL